MNAGEFASIVGAALAILVAITGFVRWLWRKRTRVRVTVAIGWITLGAERTPAIDILVRNNSAFPVTVMEWGIEQLGRDITPDPRLNETRLPHALVSGGSLTESARPQSFLSGYVSLHSSLTAWVRLANGKRVPSKPYTAGPGRQQHSGTRAV